MCRDIYSRCCYETNILKAGSVMRKVNDLGYGQKEVISFRGSMLKRGDRLKRVLLKRGVGNAWYVVVEKYMANVFGFGCTLIESYETKIN